MNRNSRLFILSATLLASNVFAGTMGSLAAAPSWSWVGAVSVGPVWESSGRTQTLGLPRTYITHESNRTLVDGEVFIGVQKPFFQQLQAQLGLTVAATSDARLSGSIWYDANPLFNNYAYNYKLQHTHVAVKGKLLRDNGSWLIPWVNGSIGVGFNESHSFRNSPTIFEALPISNLGSHSKTSFTYTVGAGVQKALNSNWQVGVGYEFADWGRSELRVPTFGHGLKLNHLYTNGVLFNLTYIA